MSERSELPAAPPHTRGAWWGYVAGLLLLGHVLVMNLLGGRWLDWNAFAARWSRPVWVLWDSALVIVVGAGLTVAAARSRRRHGVIGVAVAVLCGLVSAACLFAIWTFDTDL